jgi:hypothetical protein
MSIALADDRTVVAKLLEHIDRKTTDLSEEVWRERVEHYLSADRFEAELKVMRRTPTPFCPSALLPFCRPARRRVVRCSQRRSDAYSCRTRQ